ncbi:hypothetical protein D3C83_73600 [compost metagenome]
MRREAARLVPRHFELDLADAHAAPEPVMLLPRPHALDDDIGAKARLVERGFADGGGYRGKRLAAVQRGLAPFVVLVARRNAVAHQPKRQPLRAA